MPGVACGVARPWQQIEGATIYRPLPAQHLGCIGAAPQQACLAVVHQPQVAELSSQSLIVLPMQERQLKVTARAAPNTRVDCLADAAGDNSGLATALPLQQHRAG